MDREPGICTFHGQYFSELEKKSQCSLREAISHKNKDLVEYLVQNGTPVNDYSLYLRHHSPLHLAVISRSLEIVRILLEGGANVNVKNKSEDTPLTLAAKTGIIPLIDLLLSYNVQNARSAHSGLTHLHIACMRNETKVVQRLLLALGGENVNSSVREDSSCWAGFTPLHFAVQNECAETVKILLSCRADITAKDSRQMTPLHLADFQRNEEILDLILAEHLYVFENPSNRQGLSHFHIACTRNSPMIVEHFLKFGVDVDLEVHSYPWKGWKSIHFAIHYECSSVVELLLNTKVSLESLSLYAILKYPLWMGNRKIYDLVSLRRTKLAEIGEVYTELTGLHNACIQDNEKLFSHENIASYSVLNAPIWTGCTPVHLAVLHGSWSMVKFLLDKGANFNLQDAKGRTALHIAFDYHHTDIINTIAEKLNDCVQNLTDEIGLSIFHILCSTKRVKLITQLLSHSRIDVNSQVGRGSVLWAGFTPMHFAVQFLQEEVVVALLKSGVDISIKNASNVSPVELLINKLDETSHRFDSELRISRIFSRIVLSEMEQTGKSSITAISLLHALCMSSTRRITVLRQYLSLGFASEIDKTTNLPNNYRSHECTALHLSMQRGEYNKAKLLLEERADPLMVNSMKQTPLECAVFDIQRHASQKEMSLSDIETLFSLGTPIENYKPSHFHLACHFGIVSVMKYLLDKAPDEKLKIKFIHSRNDDGATPLHSVIAKAYDMNTPEILLLLLENGADVDARDFRLQTPLHLSIEKETDFVRKLVSYGADVNAQNLYGQTPLLLLSKSQNLWTDKEKLVLLLENGADINVVNDQGRTCLTESEILLSNVINDPRYGEESFIVLLEHVHKLQIIGSPINTINEEAYVRMAQHYSESYNEATFTSKCQKELKSMMFVKIDSRTTLRDIIFKSPSKMVLYTNNVVLQTLINSREYFEKFPVYGYLIVLKLRISRITGPLLPKCVNYFPLLINRPLPLICVDTIFDYFSNTDLKNIISAWEIQSESLN